MTDNTKNVDWTQPIEAVHEDGRVVAASRFRDGICWPDDSGQYHVQSEARHDAGLFWNADGTAWPNGSKWTIRNVVEAKADVEWGPEIKVEGRRPEWLGDDDVFMWEGTCSEQWFRIEGGSGVNWTGFSGFVRIRLPANHTHYKTLQDNMPQNAPETHRQGTNGVRTGVEALERLEALESLVRRMAATDTPIDEYLAIKRDARALLPEPVDPDLVEARELVCECVVQFASNDTEATLLRLYRAGEGDNEPEVQKIYAAIKRGRALERGEN